MDRVHDRAGEGPPTTEVALLIKVVRAALGLGNLQDGGHVIIGIDDKQLTQLEPGLTTGELASWLVYDELATTMKAYSDPPLECHPHVRPSELRIPPGTA